MGPPLKGMEIEILKIFSNKLNFTYNTIDCNYDWGVLLPNKSWTGIIGQLAEKV